ncbi:hypothetical protein B0H14DRAFT_3607964 [Mycena olivaceomarginata]|nr:hypothetical protein B0H14DRAFT_3607964 [Mycena olivaceomarginata]
MLDPTPAVPNSTRHNPFKFDDRPTFMIPASVDPPVSPSMQAHVLCMQLDDERIEGEGQSNVGRIHVPMRLPSAPLPALAVAVLPRWPRATTIAVLPLSFPGLRSTQECPHTPDASPAHTGTVVAGASLRSVATCTSAVLHLPSPFLRLVSPRLAGAWRAPSAATTNPLHAARDVLRDCNVTSHAVRRRHARHHASAHPSSDPHRRPHGQCATLTVVVSYAAFVASPGYTTALNSVPPSRPDARPCRGLEYHPQYVPRPQPAPRSFLVAFSYATAIYCPHPSTHAARRIPNTTPTSQHLRQPPPPTYRRTFL